MKNDSTTTTLNFVLAALVILGVLFAVMGFWRGRDLRIAQGPLQQHAQRYQFAATKLQALVNDALAYNSTAKSPELAQILQSVQQQPAAPGK
jgi:hypothetical protein